LNSFPYDYYTTVIRKIELKLEKKHYFKKKHYWNMLQVTRNDQLTFAQVRGRKQEDKWTGSKHVSHILKKAPEERYTGILSQCNVKLRRTYRPAFRLRSAPASFRDSTNLFACQESARELSYWRRILQQWSWSYVRYLKLIFIQARHRRS